jgi:hypothetical protein
MTTIAVQALCEVLCSRYDALIGVFLDGSVAMGEFARGLRERHLAMLRELRQGDSPVSLDDINPPMTYNGMAEDSSGPLHNTTVVACIQRNGVNGANAALLTQMCLVMAYQYWEDDTRGRIAEAKGQDKRTIEIPIMGELRHLRRSIVHNASRALPELERNTLLPAFERNTPLEIGSQRYLDIMFALKRSVREYE